MRNFSLKKFSCYFVFTLLITAHTAQSQSIRINEFMALNASVLMDEDQDYSDWIEIYNTGETSVNLIGWSLSDDKQLPAKWVFPQTTLNAGEFLIVFASGKNKAEAGDELHTNFKLSGDGEYFALYNSSGIVVTAFDDMYPAQQADCSYGWYINSYYEFAISTPGQPNNLSTEIIAPSPIFNVEHGFFESSFQLQISSSAPDSKIYYTTDGSVPGVNNGTLYSSNISISTTSVIRAVVVIDGLISNKITTQTYIFLDDVIHQTNSPDGYPAEWGPYSTISGMAIADYEMDPELMADVDFANKVKAGLIDIPTISLVTDKDHFFSHSKDENTGGIYIYTGSPAGDPIGRGWERPVSFEYFDPNSSNSIQVDCGIRLQGGHGRLAEKLPKHSFLLTFKSEYGPSKLEHAFFGEQGKGNYDKLILKGGFGNSWGHHSSEERNRAQYQRDIWTKDTQRDMGSHASNSIYCHLYINGIYWGIFAPSERMDSDFGSKYMGGKSEDWDVIKDKTEIADGNDIAWNKLFNMANAGLESKEAYQKIQGNNADGTANPHIESMLDVVNLTDYMIINFYGSNTDWDHHNWAAMRNRVNPDKGYKFLCWDGEHMIKSVNGNVLDENNDLCPSRLFQQLMKNEEYKRLFANRVQKHCSSGGALSPEANASRWWMRRNQVEKSIVAESARWGDYRRDVHPYKLGPYELYTYTDHWLPQQDFMLNTYFPNRTDVFIDQLRKKGFFPGVDAPLFLINNEVTNEVIISKGSELSMSVSEGTIYYTTDGSDPVIWQTESSGSETIFVTEDADKRVLVPKSSIGNDWYTDIDFDDSAWQLCTGSPGGVGYEIKTGYEDIISLDVSADMYDTGTNPNTSCYLRIPFHITAGSLEGLTSLVLRMTYDDAFIAYINGKEVAKNNITSGTDWNAVTTASHEAGNAEVFNITEYLDLLVEGNNVLAIQGVNMKTSSSDFIINAALIASDVALGVQISEKAIQYTSSVSIDQSVHVVARTFFGSEWSAINDQFFMIEDNYYDLKMTEIQYNPLGGNSIDGAEFEFIELKNTGTSTIYLGDLQFTNGIDYTFSTDAQLGSQEFIVLASNSLQFYSRYGFSANGEYSGKLDNNGEQLVLETSSNDTIISLAYNNGDSWPVLADGGGNSLVPIDFNPTNDQINPTDWRASHEINGSPGSDDLNISGNEQVPVPIKDLVLAQNYPNPFSNITYIDYKIPNDAFVNITVYNLMGQQVATLVNEDKTAGVHQVKWDNKKQQVAQRLPNGIYIYRLIMQSQQGSISLTKRMILLEH